MSEVPSFFIGNRLVSADKPCYVIAEIGVNHNGELDLAMRLIKQASEAGADAVKFQIFKTEALVVRDAPKADYQISQTGPGNQLEMLSALELSTSDFLDLRDYCNQCNIDFLATAFDYASFVELLALQPLCLKWPSGELTNHAFLSAAAKTGLPILLSTGMAELEEIEQALEVIGSGSSDVAVLQCVSNYPARLEDQNLTAIREMARQFKCVTGFSDHTQGPWAAIAARPLGMAILEKHITLDRTMPGPDHAASMESAAFQEMIGVLRKLEIGLGDGHKRPVAAEISTRLVARKSLVFAHDLVAGHTLSEQDFATKRPGTGIGPDRLSHFLDRNLTCDVKADQQLAQAHVA